MTSDQTQDQAAREAELDRLSIGERVTLAVLGVLALAGLGVLEWQRRPPPLTLAGAPAPSVAAAAASARLPAARWDDAVQAAREVDVNTADAAELERLPGVGPALAKRMVEERERGGPFRSAEDLQRVRGIGPKTSERLKDSITTE